MTNEEKILTILEKQEKTLENIQTDVKELKQGQAQHKTTLEVLGAGHQDLVEHTGTENPNKH
jgi:hypothetical protein